MAKSNWPALFINASWIVGIPNPMNFVLLNTTINNAIIIPPIKGRKGVKFILLKTFSNNLPVVVNANAVNPKMIPAKIAQAKVVREISGILGML